MDIFKTAGNNLMGNDKLQFDEIKVLIDAATVDMLLRPDWETNIRVVDAINACNNQITIDEVIFLIRKKFSSSQPKTVFLALTLVEALVKNCGPRIYMAVNKENFMKELGKTAKKYVGKSGTECIEVATLALDIIQAWGEAFLPLQHRYPNIPKLYQDLRRDRLPFSSQYDRNRVPILSTEDLGASSSRKQSNAPAPSVSTSYDHADEDESLAAALAASLQDLPEKQPVPSPTNNRQRNVSFETSTQVKSNNVEAVNTTKSILCEIIIAASFVRDVIQNELSEELYQQLKHLSTKLSIDIEQGLLNNPEGLQGLFEANDEVHTMTSLYERLKSGSCSLDEAKRVVAASKKHEAASVKKEMTSNLLDLESPTQSPSRASALPVKAKQTSAPSEEETMGMFSMSFAQNTSSYSPQKPPKQTPVATASATHTITTKPNIDQDPFGPSSSIDDLLLSPSTLPPQPVVSPPPPISVKPTSYDPFSQPAPLLTPQPSVASFSAPVDPLDSLLAIATRADDFNTSPLPDQRGVLAPPSFQSNIPQTYPNFPPPVVPNQGVPYPGAPYGGSLGQQPFVSPSQPLSGNWPGNLPQPSAPIPYWQVGAAPAIPPSGVSPMQQRDPFAAQGISQGFPPQRPNDPSNSNPFDLF